MLSRTRPPPGWCFMLCPVITYAFSAAEISHFADPWLRLRSAAGSHLRYPAGLDDGGKYRSENDRFFSLVGQAYVFKFLWSPLMDRYTPPFLGRRRGWLLTTQVLLLLAIAAMGFLEPVTQLRWMAALAVVIAFCSASQDIVFDAWKTDVLPAEERGAGAAISVLGYRLGMLVSGGLALWLADRYLGWQGMYWLMAALLVPCIIATLLAPEPSDVIPVPRSLEQAVAEPLRDFSAATTPG